MGRRVEESGEPTPSATSADYPFTSRWFDHGAYRQHYLDEGDGSPVLMLHGNPSWSYYWRHLVAGLRDSHRCVVPDHIGMGLSARPAERDYRYTLASRVDDLEALTSHLVAHGGAPSSGWTLVMHDWGGPIGMAWAARHPDLVARLVVLNTAAFPSPFGPRLPLTLRLPLWAVRRTRLARHLVLRRNAMARGAARYGVTHRMAPQVRAGYLAPYGTPEDRLAILRFIQDIPVSPADRAWDELLAADRATALLADRPVLIGWGARDPVFRRAFLDEWRRRFPDADCRIHSRSGHYIMEDQRDAMVAEIRAFLADDSRMRDGAGERRP
ncbi:alpha/beta fold hydrolase [Peterkaempfera bronchialis]|uniref:Alpha/beta fold hydrolase n=1 Tax=Peterkaempfera bronchialis TaxID=2126346 RepID=A0A345T3Y2_9ACTN|nr:alpha/beta fold hydrolase [Peterkaempfera bronchialis]AXI80687.1 alpha/beta fold hydrolase [Peterkaempfera bronchialis]